MFSVERKLFARNILIFNDMYNGSCKGCLTNVIKIPNEKEWYHITSNCYFPLCLDKVLSGIMLVGNDVKDGFDDDENMFSACKALYMVHENLIPHEENQVFFTYGQTRGA